MRLPFVPVALVMLVGCSALPATGPLPPPTVDDATVLLNEVIDAGIERDWDRLCANASGTCAGELDGYEAFAPVEPPTIVDVSVAEGDASTSGGVLFVLCGTDGHRAPYESEVLVFDAGDRLLATAAVYWTGMRIGFAADAGKGVVVGEPNPVPGRCP